MVRSLKECVSVVFLSFRVFRVFRGSSSSFFLAWNLIMDFFEQQDVARRRTGWLILYFILAVVAIVVAIYFVVLIALGFVGGDAHHPGVVNPYANSPWQPELFAIVAGITIGVIALASVYKTTQLASGGETVALMMGGRLIDPQTRDLNERRLLNVVEEVALASGTPVPPVYVMENEPSINAFAAGHQPSDAVIGVSQGCLDYLDRDELQGVMAHEFSHILNGDMRLNIRLIGILHGILVIALVGWFVLRTMGTTRRSSSSSNEKGGGGALMVILMIGVGLLVIGSVGLFFGKLIKSAVSRQREFLADASAVQFTRLPDGIAGALKKIGGRPETSKINDPHAEEISHMFFGSAAGSFTQQLFATHPPLDERIRRIDPTFDGEFPKVVEPVAAAAETRKPPRPALDSLTVGGKTPLDPGGVLGQIGFPGMDQILYAATILESMPQPLRDAAHGPYGARAVVYAVLLGGDAAVRARQLDSLRAKAEPPSYQETERLIPLVDGLPGPARLPLVETAFPALRQLSPEQYKTFRETVEVMIHEDNQIDLLEYTIRTMLLRGLDVHFGLAKPVAVAYRRMEPILPSLVAVLSALAYAGQNEEDAARAAFASGMSQVGLTASLAAKADCSLRSFDAAAQVLAAAAPILKRKILAACMTCVAADNQVTPTEAQLIQAVAANLGVPIPAIGQSA
jgi:Zn-dependent protease with chaperone function